ncbi:MAG: ABC transporter permease [Phycisphaerales bacterium]|nr:ABC transporter permease [Phycisphaerales bacterium]
MKLRERLAQIDRLQNSRLFKIIASCVIIAIAIALLITYVVIRNAPTSSASGQPAAAISDRPPETLPSDTPEPQTPEEKEALARAKAIERTAFEETGRAVDKLLAARSDPTSVASGIAVIAAMALVVVWLGLALTYLALAIAVAAVVAPLYLLGYRETAQLAIGVIALTAAFLALLQGSRVLLSGSGPVMAIARNMLTEAVRMKASLILIIALIVGMAALPGILSEESPLRYRVQTFLQFGTGGSFWVIALLTLLFACASMAYEQREKVIWQTMTKPVAPWQYILGKWLGLITLNAVLLIVCASSVFLFTEHLRGKAAIGEVEPFVAADGRRVTEDRLILESQVLASRVRVPPLAPELDPQKFLDQVALRVDEELKRVPGLRDTPELRQQIHVELLKSVTQAFRSIGSGDNRRYLFANLMEARESGVPLTFRYQVDAGSNRPDELYRIGLSISGSNPVVKEVALGVTQTVPLLPSAVLDDGIVVVDILNGDPYTDRNNPETISFPQTANGLEISYSSGSYRWNYLRVMGVMWLKLSFLAMLAVWAGTFLSFPVACLVSFGTFITAEGASFLRKALEYYNTVDEQGNVSVFAVVVRAISVAVANVFKLYSDLKPTEKLVEGLRLPWSDVAVGAMVLAGATFILYALAVYTLKKRELAVYSGQ